MSTIRQTATWYDCSGWLMIDAEQYPAVRDPMKCQPMGLAVPMRMARAAKPALAGSLAKGQAT